MGQVVVAAPLVDIRGIVLECRIVLADQDSLHQLSYPDGEG
jgi:hypothetical protein